ncbi:MAG TPA: ATP-binding protein [Thermotogota bacterium]|mgnify:CR=1 FL=1|nr:ATP-binding protein [Thermotogota bacterium]HPJ89553.1 ATP-binding protein [Thermotogota bacterium]HPR95762.1 ATP-binding protein [Thermotogota bacterium]
MIFYSPIESGKDILINWISPQQTQTDVLTFPYILEQRGPIYFTMYGEINGSISTDLGMVLPAVEGAEAEVLFNGEKLETVKFNKDQTKSNQMLYSHPVLIPQDKIVETNKIIIQYHARDKLELLSAPYFGDYTAFEQQLNAMWFLGVDFYMIVFGMGAFLAIILISLGKHVSEKKQAYMAIGIAVLFNAVVSFLYVLDTPDIFPSIVNSPTIAILSPMAYIFYIYFLVIGIESYYNRDSSKLVIAKKLLLPNLIACVLIYLGISLVQYVMSYICLTFMLYIAFSKKTTEFIFPVTVLTASTIYLLVIDVLGSVIPFPIFAMSSMMIIFSFGIIMVGDFQKTHKELQSTSDELYASYEELTAMNEELESSYRELDRKVEDRTYELNKTTMSLKSLLDNTEEGFLTFSGSLIIDKEYSLECERIFGGEVADRSISSLLSDNEPEIKEFLDKIFLKILNEKNDFEMDMYMSLLPEEIKRNSRTIKLNYRLINSSTDGKKIMMILHDISERIELQNEIEHERNILKMVIKVSNSRTDYLELLHDYRQFSITGISQIIDSNLSSEDKISEIYRMIHTYKGSFANFDAINAVKALHEFETKINTERNYLGTLSNIKLNEYFDAFDYSAWIRPDTELIRELLGGQFFSNEQKLVIEPDRIVELENKVAESELGEEGREFLIELKRLRYTSFREMLGYYRNYVNQLAQRMGKFVEPMIIDGDDIPVDKELYKPLIRSLTHIFRNSIYHGIETPEERVLKGKSEYGIIKVFVTKNNNEIVLTISDDGKGVKLEEVEKKALEIGLIDGNTLDAMTYEEKLKLILMDKLSTSKTVTDISGRGVGLSALNNELSKFNGYLEIKTVEDAGTSFILHIPIKEAHEMPKLPLESILNMLKMEVDKYLHTMAINVLDEHKQQVFEAIELYRYNALIKVSGTVYATTFLSLEEKAARAFASRIIMCDDESTMSERDIQDGVAETCNIFTGNALGEAAKEEAILAISSPVSINCEKGSMNHPDKEKYVYLINTDYGRIKFGVIEK